MFTGRACNHFGFQFNIYLYYFFVFTKIFSLSVVGLRCLFNGKWKNGLFSGCFLYANSLFCRVYISYCYFFGAKSNQKTWRKLTRTVGLWVFGVLGCSSRSIIVYSFGNELLPERCLNRYCDMRYEIFCRWLCGFATGVYGWEVGCFF